MGAFTNALVRIASSAPRRARLLSEMADEMTQAPHPSDEYEALAHPSKRIETPEDRRRTFEQVARIRDRAALVYPARAIPKSRRKKSP